MKQSTPSAPFKQTLWHGSATPNFVWTQGDNGVKTPLVALCLMSQSRSTEYTDCSIEVQGTMVIH